MGPLQGRLGRDRRRPPSGGVRQVKAVPNINKNRIEGYFTERLDDISVLSSNDTVANVLGTSKQVFNKEGRNPAVRSGGPLKIGMFIG